MPVQAAEPFLNDSDRELFENTLRDHYPPIWLQIWQFQMGTMTRSIDTRHCKFADIRTSGSGRYRRYVWYVKQSKTGKNEQIELRARARAVYLQRLKLAEKAGSKPIYLFQSDSPRHRAAAPYSYSRIWQVWKAAARGLDLPNNVATHSARKTPAAKAWRAGVRMEEVGKALGHKDPRATPHYLGIDQANADQLRRQFAN